MCHVGRHSDWHDGTSYLHNTSRTSGAAAEVAADKKTAKYAPLAQTYVFVPIAVETIWAHQQRRTWIPWRPGKAHYTSHRWYPRVRLPVPATVSSHSALQCVRHPGHLCPQNIRWRILGRCNLFVFFFNFVFNPRDLYYLGQK